MARNGSVKRLKHLQFGSNNPNFVNVIVVATNGFVKTLKHLQFGSVRRLEHLWLERLWLDMGL